MKTEEKIKLISKHWESSWGDTTFLLDKLKTYQGKDIDDVLMELTPMADVEIAHLSEIAAKQGEIELVKTNMDFLDQAMGGGITKGGSMVVAAMAGSGKTTFMQTISYHFAKQDVPCLWFSYEENINSIWSRFKDMGLTDKHLLSAPMDLEDNKIDYIERTIRTYKKTNEFFVVFIDQLSHIAPKVDGKTNMDNINKNFALYLGVMSTQLKELAMKHGIVIVLAHQLGRSGELAYSDMVRHAPDKVIYLERELATPGSSDRFTDKTFLKMNKNRPIGTSPIIPMRVIKNRFCHYMSTELAEDAKEMMDAKQLF